MDCCVDMFHLVSETSDAGVKQSVDVLSYLPVSLSPYLPLSPSPLSSPPHRGSRVQLAQWDQKDPRESLAVM